MALDPTGENDLGILTAGAAGALIEPLPPSPSLQIVSTLEEMRGVINQVAASAQRMMSIFSPDLEPDVYDQTPFLDILKRFVLARNFAKVRILLTDRTRMIRDGNRLVAMSRRLTSYIEMRPITRPENLHLHSFIIADDKAIAIRLRNGEWSGVTDMANVAAARQQLADFDVIWQANVPDYGFRAVVN